MSQSHDFVLDKKRLIDLRRAHKMTRSKRKSYRINAVVLLGQGWSYEEVSDALLLDTKTLRNYVSRYCEQGISGLLEDEYDNQGHASKLTREEESQLVQHLEEMTYRRIKEIVAYIESEYDVKFSRSGATDLLHRLGFTYKKPRKVPGKADPEKQEAHLKRYKKIREKMAQDDHLLFLDGVHPHHNPLVMYGWIKKGENKVLCTNTRYHRLNILGALDIDSHDIMTQFSDKLNNDAALDFLEKIRKKYKTGKLYLVLDNAGYFISPLFQQYATALGIELIYLPPYSPNLNVIERVWLHFQKNILYNHYYASFEQFKYECKRFFRYFHKYRHDMTSLLTEKFEILQVT